MREAEERKQRSRNMVIAGVATVAVLALVVAGALAVVKMQPEPTETAEGGAPFNVSDNGGFIVGQESAPVTADIYLDFMCPMCARFEEQFNPVFAPFVEDGTLKLQYHPVSILDQTSRGTKFSTRSANATYCIANSEPEKTEPFLKGMFAQQPAEFTTGLNNEQILQIATDSGVTADIGDCMKGKTFFDYVEKQTLDSGISGTPTLKLNGEEVVASQDPAEHQRTPELVTAKIRELADLPAEGQTAPEGETGAEGTTEGDAAEGETGADGTAEGPDSAEGATADATASEDDDPAVEGDGEE